MISSTHRTQFRFQRFLVMVSIALTIAVLVIIGLIPLYLTRPINAPTFSVTYVLVDQSTNDLDFDSIDRVKIARSFELGLGLHVENVLNIRDIYLNTPMERNSLFRRKRFEQCSGPALSFDFNLTYPIMNENFDKIYQQFQTVPSLSLNFNNTQRRLRLCSFNGVSYADVSFDTQNSSTENEVDLTTCLKKVSITQELTPPHRINSTSTLFFQDNYSLIVVGASKFETTTKQTIIIDGIMVYKNCQRTFDVSLPMVCNCSTSSSS